MCGILGLVENDSTSFELRFKDALNALNHRGPDDRGTVTYEIDRGFLALGHSRLSIIDLSVAGRQPMFSKNERYIIIANGEIYNYLELRNELSSCGYTFKTETDTEVLLAAWENWGVTGLTKLIGMFAFAVYDSVEQSITLIRDAFGIKPLFYVNQGDLFGFASEMAPLISLLPEKPKEEKQQVYDYISFGTYDDNAQTFYEGISHVPPGHILRFNLKAREIQKLDRWWWPSIAERSDLSFEEAAKELKAIFLKNVKLHMRSDVPIGAALSGGIDSAAIVCAMRLLEPNLNINTFTYVAPGSVKNEEKWADIVNKHTDSTSHKAKVEHGQLMEDLADMVKTQGEPFGSTSIYAQYRVFRLAKDAGITVTLDGQGADELFAGYDGYPLAYMTSLFEKRQFLQLFKFLYRWSRWPDRSFKKVVTLLAQLFIPRFLKEFLKKIFFKNPSWINLAHASDDRIRLYPARLNTDYPDAKGRRLACALRSALTGKGLAALLRHSDRNSMRFSIESRVPFLTIEMAEFILSLPESYLLSSDGETKHIFRAAMRGLVPDIILDRKDKVGFETPEKDWLKNGTKQLKEELQNADSLINLKYVQSEIDESFNDGKSVSRVWRYINYLRWSQL